MGSSSNTRHILHTMEYMSSYDTFDTHVSAHCAKLHPQSLPMVWQAVFGYFGRFHKTHTNPHPWPEFCAIDRRRSTKCTQLFTLSAKSGQESNSHHFWVDILRMSKNYQIEYDIDIFCGVILNLMRQLFE